MCILYPGWSFAVKLLAVFFRESNLVPWKKPPFSHVKNLLVMKRSRVMYVNTLKSTLDGKRPIFFRCLGARQHVRTAVGP